MKHYVSLPRPRSGRHTRAGAATLLAALALAGGATAADAAPGSEPITCSTGAVTLHSANPSRDLVVTVPNTSNGSLPLMTAYSGALSQRWCAVPIGGNHVELRNRLSGKCLTTIGPAQNGTPVNQQSCVASSSQRWVFLERGDRNLYWSVGTSRCLDIVGQSRYAGATLRVWSCNSSAWSQLWSSPNWLPLR